MYNFKTSFSLGRNKRTDVKKMAYRSLTDNLNPIILNYVKRKRFHQILLEELPWRAQINLYLASAHFHLFLLKLTERTKMRFSTSHSNVRCGMTLENHTPFMSRTGTMHLNAWGLNVAMFPGWCTVFFFFPFCYDAFFAKQMLSHVSCGANLPTFRICLSYSF